VTLDVLAPFRLDGKVAVLTGASSGLGARFARVLDGLGASVVLGARRLDRIEALAGELSSAVAVRCDVSQPGASDELVTAATEKIPIKVALLNNAYLGMVRQWQEMFYEERYSEVYLSPELPDYKLWAEAMGCVGIRVESPEEVPAAIQKANEIDDRPVVVEFRCDSREKVFPMVASGASNDDVLVHPSQAGRPRGGAGGVR